MKEFIDKLISRLEKYEYSHLIEHDSEECLHCQENDDDGCGFRNCFVCVWDKAKEIVNQLAEEYKGGWVPCEVRLPNKEESTDVYVTYMDSRTKERFVDIECYFHGVWVKSLKWYESRVAWMPLPSPYQKEGE